MSLSLKLHGHSYIKMMIMVKHVALPQQIGLVFLSHIYTYLFDSSMPCRSLLGLAIPTIEKLVYGPCQIN